MIDLNNQLLGDGSPRVDLGDALAICEQAHRDGVEEIVVTLRMAKLPGDDSMRARSFECSLNELRAQLSGKVRISCGYEWALSGDLTERLRNFNGHPAINESDYLLIGFPSLTAPVDYEQVIGKVFALGYAPIISHPECSRAIRRNPSMIGDLIKLGCLIQADALSVVGGYTNEIELFTRELLERAQVHFIASRAGRSNRREPSLSAAMERASKIIGSGSAQCLVKENPISVLANESKIETYSPRVAAPALETALNPRT